MTIATRNAIVAIIFLLLVGSGKGAAQVPAPGGAGEDSILRMLAEVTSSEHGRGLVIGETADALVLATAGHVIGAADTAEVSIDRGPLARASVEERLPMPDIAILTVAKPAGFRKTGLCAAPDLSARLGMHTWLYGEDGIASVPSGQFRGRVDTYAGTARGFDEIVGGYSGGAVLGPGGVLGLATLSGPVRGEGYQLFYVEWAAIRQAALKAVPDATLIPDCPARPLFDPPPATCERDRPPSCWVKAAYSSFRAAPVGFSEHRMLARGVARDLGPATLAEIVALLPTPTAQAEALLDAAGAAQRPDALGYIAEAENVLRDIEDQDVRFPLAVQLIARLAQHGEMTRATQVTAALRAEAAAMPLELQPLRYLQIAFYAVDLDDARVWGEIAGDAVAAGSALRREKWRDAALAIHAWVASVGYYEVGVSQAAVNLRRLHSVSLLPDYDFMWLDRSYSFFHHGNHALMQILPRHAEAGDDMAASIFVAEYEWWEPGEFWRYIGYKRAIATLTSGEAFDAAQRLIASDVDFSDDARGRAGGWGVREALDALFEVASDALGDPPRLAAQRAYRFALDFMKRNAIAPDEFMERLPRPIMTLCEADEAEVALMLYVELLAAHASNLQARAVNYKGLFVNQGPVLPPEVLDGTSDTVWSEGLATEIGVELPMCIAVAQERRGNPDVARKLTAIAAQFVTNSRVRIGRAQLERDLLRYATLSPIEQVETTMYYLTDRHQRLFEAIDRDRAVYPYASALLEMTLIDDAREALGDDRWTQLVANSSPESSWGRFRAEIAAGRVADARVTYADRAFGPSRSQFDQDFEYDAVLALMEARKVPEALRYYQMLGRDRDVITPDLLALAARLAASASDYEALVTPFLPAASEARWQWLWTTSDKLTAFRDLDRAVHFLRWAYADSSGNTRSLAYAALEAVRLAVELNDLEGISQLILLAPTSDAQARMFLTIARVH